MNKILFITYDGILEPLGYTQILSYLKILSKENNISIISIEKNNDLQNKDYFNKINDMLKNNNIDWNFLTYKKGISKYFLLINLTFTCIKLLKKNNYNILHARSYVSGLIVYFLKFFFKFYFIFDIRGFWIEERVEWGLWSKYSIKYIIFKLLEKKLYNKSQSIVSLTHDAKKIIENKYLKKKSFSRITVIPTCTFIEKKFKKNTNLIPKFTHLGSIGTRYDFPFFIKLMSEINKRKKIALSIINKNEHDKINKLFLKSNDKNLIYKVQYIQPMNIIKELYSSDFGVFFPVKGYYLKAYFPTKLGEFLSSGTPIITSSINEHVDNLILNNNVGIVIDLLQNIDYDLIYSKIKILQKDVELTDRCFFTAEKYFNITNAANIYSKIYRNFE